MADEVLGLGLKLRDLSRTIRLFKHVHPGDRASLPTGALGVLMYVREHPTGCHGKALAARAGLDPSTVSRAVATLVDRGLVARQADPVDGRATVLVLTDVGRKTLDRADQEYGDVLERALGRWTPAELASFTEAIDRFTTDVDRELMRPGVPPAPRSEALEVAR
jgi:DNA-binding MarR family transcriptional regulator